MAGYIGSKTSVTQVDGYNRTEADDEFVNDPNSVITVSGSNVGIGTSSPAQELDVNGQVRGVDRYYFKRASDNYSLSALARWDGSTGSPLTGTAGVHTVVGSEEAASSVIFAPSNTERMVIDSSGNLLVGKTTPALATAGTALRGDNAGLINSARAGTILELNRLSTDGSIVDFFKDGSTVGSISADNGYLTIANGSGYGINIRSDAGVPRIVPRLNNGAADNAIDLGDGGSRYDDIYATNGTIQTSDRNEKQDIEALSDAEQRVAVACKGLLRKFRWIDSVAEKGDDARIHFGIIAQDLQDAFAAEGLDAGRYAMFISSTWWETQTEVPAVEAVEAVEATYDEDGNELTAAVEAVEAKEAYTRTDTYETLEEAPAGATERTRLGVRYPELLAFIIGAM